MPAISLWGPSTWTFFHVIAEKIKEQDYPRLSLPLFALIKRICAYLPCPDCSSHATRFLGKIRDEDILTKQDFQNMLYLFHNAVNVRKKKPMFNHVNLVKYSEISLEGAYNNFLRVYNTKGNMNLLTESFQRSFVIKELKMFLLQNQKSFSL